MGLTCTRKKNIYKLAKLKKMVGGSGGLYKLFRFSSAFALFKKRK